MVNNGKRMVNSKLILNLFDEQITTCFFLDGYHGINQIRVKTINYIEQTYILIVEILVMNYNFFSELSWNHYHMATAMLQVYCVERIESRKIANYPWYLCYQSHFVASIHFFNVDMFFLSTFSQIFNQYKKPQTNSANMLFGY